MANMVNFLQGNNYKTMVLVNMANYDVSSAMAKPRKIKSSVDRLKATLQPRNGK